MKDPAETGRRYAILVRRLNKTTNAAELQAFEDGLSGDFDFMLIHKSAQAQIRGQIEYRRGFWAGHRGTETGLAV